MDFFNQNQVKYVVDKVEILDRTLYCHELQLVDLSQLEIYSGFQPRVIPKMTGD